MEHNVYEKVQEYLALLSKIELLTCTVVHNSFKKVRDQAQQVSIYKFLTRKCHNCLILF